MMEGSGELRIPQLRTWNVAVARYYVTKMERTHMSGVRVGHITEQPRVDRWITVLPVEVCSTKSMTNRACKDMQLMLSVCVSVLLLNACKTETLAKLHA